MNIDRVILSSNADPDYLQFWPLVARAWRKFGFVPTLAIIGDVPVNDDLGEVIQIDPVEGITTFFLSKIIRIFVPTLYPEDICILSDIDMLPLSEKYFVENAAPYPDDHLIIYSSDAYAITMNDPYRYPICYVAARGDVFRELVGVSDYDNYLELVKNWFEIDPRSDETHLSQLINEWAGYPERCVKLARGGWKPYADRRINRKRWRINKKLLHEGYYIDAHLPKPFLKHGREILPLIDYLGLVDELGFERRGFLSRLFQHVNVLGSG
jgi:hypothetical protein